MHRLGLRELGGMERHELTHGHRRRCRSARAWCRGVGHAVVTPLPVQLGHGREMADDVLGKPHLPQAFAPCREPDVAIPDRPAERLREGARMVVLVGGFRPGQVVDLSDMRGAGRRGSQRPHAPHRPPKSVRPCRRPSAAPARRRLCSGGSERQEAAENRVARANALKPRRCACQIVPPQHPARVVHSTLCRPPGGVPCRSISGSRWEAPIPI
jgi:hypothetical protein